MLSDPNKKRQYDLHGEEGSVAELSTINVEDLGTVGRLFGALISKAGIPVPTEITQKVLTAAQHIGKGNTNVPGFEVPNVEELLYGQSVTGREMQKYLDNQENICCQELWRDKQHIFIELPSPNQISSLVLSLPASQLAKINLNLSSLTKR